MNFKTKSQLTETISGVYIFIASPFVEATSFRPVDNFDEGKPVYTLRFLRGTETISDVRDFEDAVTKATEYVREIFPHSYDAAKSLILDAGVTDQLTEADWNELFPSIWDGVVRALRLDIEMAWLLMEYGEGKYALKLKQLTGRSI